MYILKSYTVVLRGVADLYVVDEDTQPVIRAIGVSHTACEDEFRRSLGSHSWMGCCSIFIIYTPEYIYRPQKCPFRLNEVNFVFQASSSGEVRFRKKNAGAPLPVAWFGRGHRYRATREFSRFWSNPLRPTGADELTKDACYDRGSTFWRNRFLNGGAPSPKTVRISTFFATIFVVRLSAKGLLIPPHNNCFFYPKRVWGEENISF